MQRDRNKNFFLKFFFVGKMANKKKFFILMGGNLKKFLILMELVHFNGEELKNFNGTCSNHNFNATHWAAPVFAQPSQDVFAIQAVGGVELMTARQQVACGAGLHQMSAYGAV